MLRPRQLTPVFAPVFESAERSSTGRFQHLWTNSEGPNDSHEISMLSATLLHLLCWLGHYRWLKPLRGGSQHH